jgi:protocatechuate 3,4-dioxygenase, alpha subunit
MTLPLTPSQTVGPYFTIGLCRRPENELVAEGVRLAGRLLDGQELPVNDGVIEVWDAAGRRWGRCGTDAEGRFSFLIAEETSHVEAYVFARGLLRHQLTRICLRDGDPVITAELEDGAYRFDIRLQGDRQTVFFAV